MSAMKQQRNASNSQHDLDQFRLDTLRVLLVAVFCYAALWLLYVSLFCYDPHSVPSMLTSLVPFSLLIAILITVGLLQIRPTFAEVALPLLLLLILLAYLWFQPQSLAAFFLVPVILIASATCTQRALVALTVLANVGLFVIAFCRLGQPAEIHLMVALTTFFTALAGWLSMRNLYTATEWALYSHMSAVHNLEALRERRGELRRLTDMLNKNQDRMNYLNIHLEQAKVTAEEAYRTKQHFVANVSHELRTPLNLIMGFSELMAFSPESYGGMPLPAPYRKDIMEVYRSSKHLLSLIEDVLTLAQLEASQMIVKRDWGDLETVVREAIETMRPLIESKGLTLCVTVSPNLPAIYLDAGRIRQVLLNLINNAYRHTDAGVIAIDVWQEDNNLLIEVSDSGIGIAEKDLPHIFEDFYNLSKGPSSRSSGFGLGLSISRKLVEAHQGRLWATSQLGVGSRFYMTLPIEADEQQIRLPTLIRTERRTDARRAKPVLLIVGEDGIPINISLNEYDLVQVTPEELGVACEQYLPVAIWVNEAVPQPLSYFLRIALQNYPNLPIIHCRLPCPGEIAQQLHVDDLLVKPISRQKLRQAVARLAVERAVRRILIVDDDPRLVRMMQRVLTLAGEPYSLFVACGGKEGLEMLASEPPDLLLLDLSMPDVSGYDILNWVQSASTYESMRVILLTDMGLIDEMPPVYTITIQRQEGFAIRKALEMIELLVKTSGGRPGQV
jgi:signal transduction histidine kinase/CheY-like chemotaxis protein